MNSQCVNRESLLNQFPNVFSDEVSVMDGKPFSIKLQDGAKPFSCLTVRRVAEPLKPKLKEELENLKNQGIIEEVQEPTEWSSPISIQSKKGGKIRMCVDFRHLYKFVVRERYQSPTPLDVVMSLPKGSMYFTVVDAVKGYYQIPLHEESRNFTVFLSPFGRFRFTRAPFGLSSISEHYNRRISELIADLPNTFHVADDIIIADNDFEEHKKNVLMFLKKCHEKGVTLNSSKFVFAQPEVTFAGFRVNESGYTIDPEMVVAIREFPEPKTRTDLRSWYGLVNQLGPFTDETASLLDPLRSLLKESNEFLWTDEHRQHFEKSREMLCKVPVLAYYDPSRKTKLFTDASRIHGIGFILKQLQNDGSWRMVRAGSRCLTSAESRYAMIELEMMAIVWAIHKCRLMLEGMKHFDVVTDHLPLIPILNKYTMDRVDNPRLWRLKQKVIGYNFTASWISTAKNSTADALSRAPVSKPTAVDDFDDDGDSLSFVMTLAETSEVEDIRRASLMDNECILLSKHVMDGFPHHKFQLPIPIRSYWNVRSRLSIDNGIILCGHRMVIPVSLRQKVLKDMLSMHQGATKMKERARQSFYWPRMDNDIHSVVLTCQSCQEKLPSLPKEKMIRREAATRAFESVHADFFQYGGRYYLVYVDEYSGWPAINYFGSHASARDLT